MDSEPTFSKATDLMSDYRTEAFNGTPPELYVCGEGSLRKMEIGPGVLLLLGGAPGAGKTAFAMQIVIDALRMNGALKALVCNVEMLPRHLLDRQMARLSGIDGIEIRHRRLQAEHRARIEGAQATLNGVADRLCFLRAPHTLERMAQAAQTTGAKLLLFDYLQRIRSDGTQRDQRAAVNHLMSKLRDFAESGRAVIAIAAVGRTKDKQGRTSYDAGGMNLASFRESSELEYGADDAYILVPNGGPEKVLLKHVKSRYGAQQDIPLNFHRPCQRFTSVDAPAQVPNTAPTAAEAELERIWNAAPGLA